MFMCVTVTVYGYSIGNIVVVNKETIEFKSSMKTKASNQTSDQKGVKWTSSTSSIPWVLPSPLTTSWL